MPCIGRPGLAFGCVTALGIFFRSIFNVGGFLLLGFRKSERQQPRKATAKGDRCKLACQRLLAAAASRRPNR